MGSIFTTHYPKLKKLFNFPLDIEWVFNHNTQLFTLLQVRPQTHLVGTLRTASQLPTLLKVSGNTEPYPKVWGAYLLYRLICSVIYIRKHELL